MLNSFVAKCTSTILYFVYQIMLFFVVCFFVTSCLSVCLLPFTKRRDVVSERKTKPYLPPPQPASLENNPKLLLIWNSFVSRTTRLRPYLRVGAFVHQREENNMYVCEREREVVGSSFSFVCSLLVSSHLISTFHSFCTSPLLFTCLQTHIFVHTEGVKLRVNGISWNRILMQFW